MTAGVVKSQGTHLYFVPPSSTDSFLVKLGCPTGMSGLGGAKDQTDVTCLDNTDDKEYVPGLGNPGQVSVPFNLIPSHVSHQVLFDLKETGSVIDWIMCLSDGTAQPSLDTDDKIVPPVGRTSFEFKGYVSDVNIDVATGDIVKGTLTIQRSGKVIPHWQGPTP